jgi:hypothetical protein
VLAVRRPGQGERRPGSGVGSGVRAAAGVAPAAPVTVARFVGGPLAGDTREVGELVPVLRHQVVPYTPMWMRARGEDLRSVAVYELATDPRLAIARPVYRFRRYEPPPDA